MKHAAAMIKTLFPLIAISLAIILGAGPAQAVTLYDDNDTKVDLYSRLYVFYANDGEGRISGNDSRVGLRASTRVHDNLSVFARAEFRYDASQRARGGIDIERDEQDDITNVDSDSVFNDRRNTYVGLKGGWGQLMAGNFDSVYYQSVSHLLDLYEHEGFVALGNGSTASREDSVAYSSPNLHGFQLHGQVRHYEEEHEDTVSGDEEFVFQVAGTYTLHALTLGLGAVIENEDAGFDETLFGFSAEYKITEALSAMLMLEHLKDAGEEDYHAAIGAAYNYGQGDLYASVGQDPDEETYFSVGANYKFSKPMRVFAEYCNGEGINPDDVITVGFRYDF